jgi:hypothetical protein
MKIFGGNESTHSLKIDGKRFRLVHPAGKKNRPDSTSGLGASSRRRSTEGREMVNVRARERQLARLESNSRQELGRQKRFDASGKSPA